jgi:GNAT superfamily N-acetyltransferase
MQVLPVTTASGRTARAWHAVPRRLYRDDSQWTPPLGNEERRRFDPRHNPSLQGVPFHRWVALADGRPVGRIAAFLPPTPSDTGHVGFFEAPDDRRVANALFDAAERWILAAGRTRSVGPVAITPRDQIGLLTEGFDRAGTVLTPYNSSWYPGLFEAQGYQVFQRLRSHAWLPLTISPTDPRLTQARAAGDRSGIRLRSLDPERLIDEARTISTLINTAFASTWGFTPVTDAEVVREARDLAAIVDPSLVWFAEQEGRAVGVAVTIPDPNWLVRKIGGRLWPTGWWTALRHRRRIPWARYMVLAVLPGHRAGGTAFRLMAATHRALVQGGYQYVELAQIFDDNDSMRRVLERIGAPLVKRFAVYQRDLIQEAS